MGRGEAGRGGAAQGNDLNETQRLSPGNRQRPGSAAVLYNPQERGKVKCASVLESFACEFVILQSGRMPPGSTRHQNPSPSCDRNKKSCLFILLCSMLFSFACFLGLLTGSAELISHKEHTNVTVNTFYTSGERGRVSLRNGLHSKVKQRWGGVAGGRQSPQM